MIITNRMALFIIVIFLCMLSLSVHAITGLELMQKQNSLHEVNTEYTLSTMTLIDRKARKRERKMVIYAKKTPEGENRSLLKFIKPRNIYNVGLLTWQHTGQSKDDQWLYLPASKRIKRIASGGKKNPFMGSDLAYEDMLAEDLTSHTYKLLGEEVVNNYNCWLVEAVPSTRKARQESGYAKRLIWLRKDITYSVKIDFFDRRHRLIKTLVHKEIERVTGKIWRYNILSVTNIRKKTSTIIQIQKRLINTDITEKFFNKNILRRSPNIQ